MPMGVWIPAPYRGTGHAFAGMTGYAKVSHGGVRRHGGQVSVSRIGLRQVQFGDGFVTELHRDQVWCGRGLHCDGIAVTGPPQAGCAARRGSTCYSMAAVGGGHGGGDGGRSTAGMMGRRRQTGP